LAAEVCEHTLSDEDDFRRHLDCIHFNPVKHGRAVRVPDWPISSFRGWVRFGAYPVDWAGDPGDEITRSGER
jgi:putative transposase